MNPRQSKEYKHSQKVKAEEMRQKTRQAKMRAEQEGVEAIHNRLCDLMEEAVDAERSKADYIYGKGAKGKMEVEVELLEGKIRIKTEFKPAEGVKPLEGRSVFGLFRTEKW